MAKSSRQTMGQTTARELLNFSPLSCFLTTLLLAFTFIIIFKHFSSLSSKRQRIPPGPKPWPIIGNIFHLGNKPYISMANFARVHGPLISLRLGTQLLVVGSSPKAAAEILRTNDRLLSGRQVPKVAPYEPQFMDRIALIWSSDCSDRWSFLRGLCKSELFSSKAIESQARLREMKVAEMVDFLASREGKIVNIGEAVFAAVFNTMGNLLFSRDLINLKDGVLSSKLKSLVWKMLELGATPNISDFYPMLAPLDLQGLKRTTSRCIHGMFATWAEHIKERRESRNNNFQKADFLDVCLANGFDNDQINWLLFVCMPFLYLPINYPFFF
uniref:Putative S-N-methylcoclaurine 3'-hydroxylase isozyme 2 n=1 Tax=Rhizophora mucronata TaxID=61149 RepID=A0A2P2IH90_RHIMU